MEGEKYLGMVKNNLAFFGLIGAGVGFLLIGFILFIQEQNKPPKMTIVDNTATASGTIKVDVEGAVLKAGVYELPNGSRVQDGLVAAGGMSSQADREYVAKNINLAAKVIDGAKIYIPNKSSKIQAPIINEISNSNFQMTNINTASTNELDKLSGVGQVTAEKIINGRPYSKAEELVEKKIVGQSVFEKIKSQITVY